EVGFSGVQTFGDFKETYHEEEPDFLVHVCEKLHESLKPDQKIPARLYEQDVQTAREYYNSNDADHFYNLVWGGEDIHIGLYESEYEPIRNASRRTVEHMASKLQKLDKSSRVLDIGSGYAG